MILPYALLAIIIWRAEGEKVTSGAFNNKTKRTLSQQLFNYGEAETRPTLVYTETPVPNIFSSDNYNNFKLEYKPSGQISSSQGPKTYHLQYPTRQILYDFPNIISNGHGNHMLQAIPNKNTQISQYKEQTFPTVVDNQSFMPAETIVLPVEHKVQNIIMHQRPLYTNTNYKYNPVSLGSHGNEKVNYELYNSPHTSTHSPFANQLAYPPRVNTIPLLPNQYNSQYQKVQRVPIVNYVNHNHTPRKLNLNIPKYITPSIQIQNTSPHKNPLHLSSDSLKMDLKKYENVKTEDEKVPMKEVLKHDDISSEEKLNHGEEEDERESSFRKPYDFAENGHFEYKDDKDSTDEDYEQDSTRGSSTQMTLKKNPKQSKNEKVNTSDYYKFHSSDYKRENPEHKPNRKGNRTKKNYKSIKFSRETHEPNEDSFEGKHSENIPVIRKHKLFKEKWFILKNTEDAEKE